MPTWWQKLENQLSSWYSNSWLPQNATANFSSTIHGLDGQPMTRTSQAAGPNPYNPNGGEEQWINFQNQFIDQCGATGGTTVCRAWAGVYGPQAICQCCK